MVICQQWVARVLIVTWICGVLLGSAVGASADEAGKKLYQRDCQACHGPDGAGNAQLAKALQVSIPPITGAALKQKDHAELVHIIAEGQGKMPGFAKKLSAEEQGQVLEYIKTLGQLGGRATFPGQERGNRRMQQMVRCLVTLACLVGLGAQTMAQSPGSLAQNPLAGSRVFGAKGCAKCHAVSGAGGTLGPDLGRSSLHRSLSDFTAAMWNRLPQMVERMRQLEMPRAHLAPWETGDLIAFLFTRQYFASSGDPQNGRQLFFAKQCAVCHQVGGVGGVLGPSLDFLQESASPIFVATAMWNHGSMMTAAMRIGQIARPTFTAAELRDLMAYFMSVSPTATQGPLYVLPGRSNVGRKLFVAKQCVECHSIKGEGGRVGPDLGARERPWTLLQFAAALWNKAPAMLEVIRARGMAVPQLRPEEMADLVAYLSAVGYFAESGDPRQGQELTTDKGCLGCHALSGQGGTRASDLVKARGLDSPAAVIAALWNHLDVVEPGSAAQQTAWPQFSASEMADLMAFLQGLGEGQK